MLKQISRYVLLALVLSSCSAMPTGPSVLVLPGTGKDFSQFHTDDAMCRQLARGQILGSKERPDSDEEGQQAYDIVYIQCMYGKGHRVPVPGDLMYDTREEWHPPPPPNMPPPQGTVPQPPSNNPPQ